MRVVLALIVVMICGCATTKPIEPQRLSQIHKIGAVSLLGDKLNIVQVGTTVFNNVNKYEPVPAWDIDRFAVTEIQKSLTTSETFTFLPIAYDQKDLADIYRSQDSFPYADFDINYVKEKLAALGKDNGIDTLLVVLSARRDLTGNHHFMHGYGVFSRSLFGAEVGASFSLGATLAVIDVRGPEVLSVAPLFIHKPLERGIWKEHISHYAPEELALLKSYTQNAIKSEVALALVKLGLVK